MTLHPEELRLANSLRDLIFELGTTAEEVEGDLGWEVERLTILLAGRKKWKLGELFEVLSSLELAPAAFFGRVYGLDSGVVEALKLSDLDRPFEESQRVVQEAVSRRFAWKQERVEIETE
jgi:hypothetical protein